MAYNIKAALRAAKNMQYEPIEVKVREATNNDPWGVSTSAMSDISRATHHHDEYALLFKMVWRRLNDHEHVMHVQKALILIDYLLRNGAERFISDAKRRARDISALQKYKQYDQNNRDVGGDVRAKAKAVYELLTNEGKLTEERGKAQAIRDVKLSGMGHDGFGHGGGDTRAREFDEDRYNQTSHGGREHDWEKEGNDASPVPNKHRHSRKKAEVEENDDDEDEEKEKREEDEPVKEKKKKKSKEKTAETETVAAAEEEPAEGEKKKKKKKKKSAAESADTTAPPSAEISAPITPNFAPIAAAPAVSFDTFDTFGANTDSFITSSVTHSGAATPAAAPVVAAVPEKTKKSRKKKDAAAAAEPAAAAPQVAQQSSAAPSISVSADYDLTNFAAIPTPRGPGGDLDILTGTNGPAAPLEDMFAQSSLMDGPMDTNGEEDGFMIEDEPALLDQPQQAPSATSPRGGAKSPAAAQKKSDIWDLASDFTNIDNIHGNVQKKKQAQQDVVSMSMMRSMQPFDGMKPATSATKSAPAANPFFGAPAAGAGFGAGGAPNPFGGIPGMQQQQQQQHHHPGMGGGFGAPNPMAGGGFPQQFGGMPGGFGMPQFGMQGGMGGMSNGMNGGGGGAFDTDLPFAAPAGSSSRSKPSNGKPIIFDSVAQARPQQAITQQPTSGAPTGPKWTR